MEIKRAGSQASGKGPADWFTGTVRIDPLFSPPDPARAVGASVTFEPGARTAWHHPSARPDPGRDRRLRRVQREGGPIEEIRPGDVVWFPPGEKHWHGATPTTALTHIAIQEKLDGKNVDWMEHVTDAQYRGDGCNGRQGGSRIRPIKVPPRSMPAGSARRSRLPASLGPRPEGRQALS
jgi:quercetin dioxygenase-like cupin family protein